MHIRITGVSTFLSIEGSRLHESVMDEWPKRRRWISSIALEQCNTVDRTADQMADRTADRTENHMEDRTEDGKED